MSSIKVFLDTEFTHFKNSQLVSIGLVSECGKEFYAEPTDSWQVGETSIFTLSHVLYLLNDGKAENILRDRLGDYFDILRWLTDAECELQNANINSLIDKVENFKQFSSWLEIPKLDLERVKNIPYLSQKLSNITPAVLSGREDLSFDVAQRLKLWLESIGPEVDIVLDFITDWNLFVKILQDAGVVLSNTVRAKSVKEAFGDTNGDDAATVCRRVKKEEQYRRGLRRHHALDDARALRSAWFQCAAP